MQPIYSRKIRREPKKKGKKKEYQESEHEKEQHKLDQIQKPQIKKVAHGQVSFPTKKDKKERKKEMVTETRKGSHTSNNTESRKTHQMKPGIYGWSNSKQV